MAIFSINHVVKTVTIHKDDCRFVPKLRSCCEKRGKQHWRCEKHASISKINEIMKGRFWAVLMCNSCSK